MGAYSVYLHAELLEFVPSRGKQRKMIMNFVRTFSESPDTPGLWLGDGGFSFGWPASFEMLSAHSGRKVAHVTSGSDGSFEVSLPPVKYVVVPGTLPWYAPMAHLPSANGSELVIVPQTRLRA